MRGTIDTPAGIRLTTHADLTPEERAAYNAVERDAFRDYATTEEARREMYDRFHGDDGIGYILAHADAELIGAIKLSRRTIPFAGSTIRLGGLGGVATREDWRRRGVASATTALAMDVLRQHGCDIAYLCTDIEKLGPLYGKVGFVALGRPHTYLGASGKRYTDDDGMIALVNSRAIFEEVLAAQGPFDIGGGNW
jgi:predicted N-acetyltransferase YhbS